MPRAYVISGLNGKEMFGTPYKKELQKKKKKIKKSLELKEINYISNGKALIILLTVDKKRYIINE